MLLQPFLPHLNRPLVISGPCSAESRGQVLSTARQLADSGIKVFRAGVWKPRTQPGGFEGCGEIALEWLKEVKDVYGMLTATEVATPEHVRFALNAGVDILWLGARTTTNPFAVQEIAEEIAKITPDTPVIIKNPINPDLKLWMGAFERFDRIGVRHLAGVHRGFSVYDPGIFRNDPCWRLPLELHRRMPDLTLLCDPSHIAGRRDLISDLIDKAYNLCFDGLIVETHCEPSQALSDAAQQLTPAELSAILASTSVKKSDFESGAEIDTFRSEIDEIDRQILGLIARRMQVSREIGKVKKQAGISVVQSERYAQLIKKRTEMGEAVGLDADFMRHLLVLIHEESVKQQI